MNHSLPHMEALAARMHLTCGVLLELGPGRVWPGLQLLRNNPDLDLVSAGYSSAEQEAAQAQARQWRVSARTQYLSSPKPGFPLPDRSVDGVVGFGSLHLWPSPLKLLDEVARVLKVGGKVLLGDVRKDLSWVEGLLRAQLGNPGLKAVYRDREHALPAGEVQELLDASRLRHCQVKVMGPEVWILSACLSPGTMIRSKN